MSIEEVSFALGEGLVRPGSADCICEWPELCGGTGTLACEGCGGDICVCKCGGTIACFGCEDCDVDEQDD